MTTQKLSFTFEEYEAAKKYWSALTPAEEREFFRHYTTGEGKGGYYGVDENTSFKDYQVISMAQTEFERIHDI